MRFRLACLLTAILLPALSGAAFAQNAAAVVVQQIHDQAYGKCMSDARFGAGSALQENCSCSADVVVDQLSPDFLHAIADGTQASFKGPKLQGDASSFNAALVQACPKLAPYL